MMITTTLGEMEESLLEKREGVVDNANEFTTWIEYRLPGSDEIIHRSAHVTLKTTVSAFGEAAKLG
jgi:hypothetical protein